MSDQLWTVTHATAEGQLRWWTVNDEIGKEVERAINDFVRGRESQSRPMGIQTTTGHVLIWLTPGQSLTVERAR